MREIKHIDVKKHLKELSKNELEKEVLNLYKKFKDVKEYFSIELNKDNLEGILSYYKEKMVLCKFLWAIIKSWNL